MHGYDVVDHSRVDASRGGPDALREFADAAHARGLKVLVDIVPNHMGVATPAVNPWWWDLLTYGQDSRYASYFDIDWEFGQRTAAAPRPRRRRGRRGCPPRRGRRAPLLRPPLPDRTRHRARGPRARCTTASTTS